MCFASLQVPALPLAASEHKPDDDHSAHWCICLVGFSFIMAADPHNLYGTPIMDVSGMHIAT
jgi:hypothetical protein